jgi:hyperosmotically inducible periplasmic protein
MEMIGQKSALAAVCCAAALLALTGCDRAGDGSTLGQKMDSAVSKTKRAATEAKQDARDAVADASSKAKDDTRSMGAAGDKPDDASITAKVNAGLAKDKDLSAVKIDVDTQNGVVTLSGPAPTATAKARAAEIARDVKGVSSVNNQLTVKAG